MKEITKEQCEELYKEYIHFSVESNFKCGFTLHTIVGVAMKETIEHFEEQTQEELKAMFRAVYKMMDRDYSEYLPEDEKNKIVN